MRALIVAVAVTIAFLVAPARAYAIAIGLLDTFQDGTTQNWFAGGGPLGAFPPVPPQNIGTGGPGGVADAFLGITSVGGNGPGSRLVAMNGTQWAGNYLSAGVVTITMDLINLGNSDLTVRLMLEDPAGGPPSNIGVTSGVFLAAGSGWTRAAFSVAAPSLTMLAGNAPALLGNVTLLRIFHAPAAGFAVPVAGLLGVDNISASGTVAVPEPGTILFMMSGLAVLAGRRFRIRGSRPTFRTD